MTTESSSTPTTGSSETIPPGGSTTSTESPVNVPMPSPPSEEQPKMVSLQRQPSIPDPNLRSCFICLLDSKETPDASWVNPCPCTLEAHEDCMLRWVAESETSRSRPKNLLCPACQEKITVVEPWDAVVKLGEKFHRLYSRASPVVFTTMLCGMSIGGSGAYGLACMTAFTGHKMTLRWLGVQQWLEDSHYSTGFMVLGKWFVLNLVAPGLLLHKVLPSVANLIAVPSSLAYGAYLTLRNIPVSPSNPEWAVTLMPYVSICYAHTYYLFFGDIERRLNRALKGPRLPEEPAAAPAADGNGENEDREEGIGTALFRLGGALVNLFDADGAEIVVEVGGDGGRGGNAEEEIPVEVEVVIENEVDEELERAIDDEYRAQMEVTEEEVRAELGGQYEQIRARNEEQVQQDDVAPQIPVVNQALEDNPVQDQPPIRDAPAEEAPQNQNNNNQQPADENRASTTLSDVVNGIVTQLLFPVVSAGIGEVLRHALPRDWVAPTTSRRPAGLLQHRWGRSLVGGCLFVVLKDALRLYSKYRRVEVKKQRKVKNVERRRDKASITAP